MKKQLVVRIPEEQNFMLTQLALQQNTTVSDLVRQAISKFLSQDMEEDNDLVALAKIGEDMTQDPDAPQDLATNYKKYLYGDNNKESQK